VKVEVEAEQSVRDHLNLDLSLNLDLACCRSGGIGRRKGLKILRICSLEQHEPTFLPGPDATFPLQQPSAYATVRPTESPSGDDSEHVDDDALVAEPADAQDLKSWAFKGRVGSSPTERTTKSPDSSKSPDRFNIYQAMPKRIEGLPRGIRPRGNVFHIDVCKRGQRLTATADTLEQAIAKQTELRFKLDGKAIWTLGVAIDKTAATAWDACKSKYKLIQTAEFARKFFGENTSLTSITTDAIDRWIRTLRAGRNSNATINRKLAALSRVLRFAKQRESESCYHDLPHFERQREPIGRLRIVSREEEAALLAMCRQLGKEDIGDAITLLLDTGMRSSELWRLEVRDIDFARKMLTVWKSKSAKPRGVVLTTRCLEILKKWSTGRVQTARIFPQLNNDKLNRAWSVLRNRMGLSEDKGFIPYALRHTCASRLIQGGVHMMVVKEWLGHGSITVTQRYVHMLPSQLLQAVSVLEHPEDGVSVLESTPSNNQEGK